MKKLIYEFIILLFFEKYLLPVLADTYGDTY